MNLRVIPTNIHGMLDYLASGVNLAFPGMLGLHDAPWAALGPRTWRSMPRRVPSWRRRLGSSGSPRTAPATGCRTC
jgi:hypothetical protein